MTPETTHPDVLPSCLYPDPMGSVQHSENSLAQDLQTNATRQERKSQLPQRLSIQKIGKFAKPDREFGSTKSDHGGDVVKKRYANSPGCKYNYASARDLESHVENALPIPICRWGTDSQRISS